MTEREKYADIIEGNQNTWLTYMSDRSETARVYAAIAYARGASCEEQIEYIKKGNSDINEVIVEHTKYPDVRLSALKYNPSDRTVSGVLRHKEKECIDYIIENAEHFKDHVYRAVESGGNEYIDKILDGDNSDLYYIAAVLGNENQIKEFISRATPDDIYLAFAEMNLQDIREEKKRGLNENHIKYREKLNDIFSSINDCMSKILNKDEYKKFLNCVHYNPKMSINNQLLVYHSRPENKEFNTYDEWKLKGAAVKKGEKGISIIQSDGNKYGIKKVFGISQTNKKPEETNPLPLKDVIASIEKATSYKIREAEIESMSKISFAEKTIFIKRGVSEERKAQGIFRELARSSYSGKYDLFTKTTEYMLCKKFGVDVSHIKITDDSFKGLATEEYLPFAHKERLNNIKNAVAKSIRTANFFISSISKSVEIEKDPNIYKANNSMNDRFAKAKNTAHKRNLLVNEAPRNFNNMVERGD